MTISVEVQFVLNLFITSLVNIILELQQLVDE